MTQRTTISKKALRESRLKERANFIIEQSKIKQGTPYVLEIILYVFVLIVLISWTYARNEIWNSDINLWTDCVKKSPNKDRPHNNLGIAYTDERNYQEAIGQFTEALRINPSFAEAHNNLGNAYTEQVRYQEAIVQFTEALKINPNYADAHYNVGIAYLTVGDINSAFKEYQILKKINPGLASDFHEKIK